MKQASTSIGRYLIILLVLLSAPSSSILFAQTTAKPFKKLVWADEFNGKGLPDSTKWGYDVGRGCPQNCGWGNNELQYYTSKNTSNARVENGLLVVEAHKENVADAKYSSARLVTKNKGDWKYGRIDVKAKLPAGRGMWPAIWMLPTDWKYGGWPHSGEIDIMENVGFWPDSVLGTVHTNAYNGMKGTQKTLGMNFKDLSTAFHEYSIEWDAEEIRFYVDNKQYNSFKNSHKNVDEWPFDQRFHLLINIAVGGNWGGQKGVDDSIFPQKMWIDYVRVYQ
ncbi:MAG: glycoside hydrolase family 16 protein [Sediminibacterium sp.]|uniref:glycoside hydrolase family 16 protein n=1 Tax=Sediminibacterium sp. TaxID=1917865 RepID=UPI00271B7707|nr:glycoside hydrolase family 16 protein [Sediminibacterium sp.]MDO8997435.1 glycoside hydrolase family 16 protein [Sediminibacterium sp.]